MSDTSLSDAPRPDAEIERALRDTVRDLYRRGDLQNLTLKRIRKAVEDSLELEGDFFKIHATWKDRSKTIVDSEVEAHNEHGDSSQIQPASPQVSKPTKVALKPKMKSRGTKRASSESVDAKPKKKRKSSPEGDESSTEKEFPSMNQANPLKSISSHTPSESEEEEHIQHPKEEPHSQQPETNGGRGQESESDMSVVLDEDPKQKRRKRSKGEPKPKGKKSDATGKAKRTSEGPGDPDQEEIKRLQGWLIKCGIRKMWYKELAPYDTSKAKVKHLKEMLADAGMTGRYSKEKADQIREERELKADLEAVQQGNKVWGNDNGEEADENTGSRPKRRLARGLQGLDFLNDDDGEETD